MQNTLKKIIFITTILILVLGIFFGIKFYQNSKNPTAYTATPNTDTSRTPFQTKVSTSTGVETIIEDSEPVTNPENNTVKAKPRLVELWKEPVSGFDFVFKDIEVISTSTTNSTSSIIKSIQNKKILKNQQFIYFWDRKTGHIYENLASTTDIVKISNYTLPGAEEVFFADNSSVVVRKLENDNDLISTTYMKLVKEFSSSTVYMATVKDISIDSNNISFSSTAKRLFYFINRTGKGVIASIDGSSICKQGSYNAYHKALSIF